MGCPGRYELRPYMRPYLRGHDTIEKDIMQQVGTYTWILMMKLPIHRLR